jgi:hypothetical protein
MQTYAVFLYSSTLSGLTRWTEGNTVLSTEHGDLRVRTRRTLDAMKVLPTRNDMGLVLHFTFSFFGLSRTV